MYTKHYPPDTARALAEEFGREVELALIRIKEYRDHLATGDVPWGNGYKKAALSEQELRAQEMAEKAAHFGRMALGEEQHGRYDINSDLVVGARIVSSVESKS